MKTLTLKISDRVLSEFKSCMSIKQMSGNMYGFLDAFMAKIANSLESGEEELFLQLKEERERDAKKEKD